MVTEDSRGGNQEAGRPGKERCLRTAFSPPPEHPFQAGAVGVRARHPFFQQVKVRRKSFAHLLARGPKWRAVRVGNQIMHGEELTAGLEPARDRADIFVAARGVDGAAEGVLVKPISTSRRIVGEKLSQLKLGGDA